MARNSFEKEEEQTGMAGNDWKWLDIAGHGCKCLKKDINARNGWTLLEFDENE